MVQNRQQTHDWTLIGSGANGIGIQVYRTHSLKYTTLGYDNIGIRKSEFVAKTQFLQ